MYDAKTDELTLCENIGIEVLNEMGVGAARYALIKIGLFGKITYAVCVLGNGYVLETLGEDDDEALDLFNMIVDNQTAPEHVFGTVADARRARDAIDP